MTEKEKKLIEGILKRYDEILKQKLQHLKKEKEERLGSAFINDNYGLIKATLLEVLDLLKKQYKENKEINKIDIERLALVFRINTLKQFKTRYNSILSFDQNVEKIVDKLNNKIIRDEARLLNEALNNHMPLEGNEVMLRNSINHDRKHSYL